MQASDIRWASRWDTYLLMTDDQIHWFSIINSLMIVLFLSGMVAMIMMRTLHRDISKYNQLETADEAQEETGWKLVCSPVPLVWIFLTTHSLSTGICWGLHCFAPSHSHVHASKPVPDSAWTTAHVGHLSCYQPPSVHAVDAVE